MRTTYWAMTIITTAYREMTPNSNVPGRRWLIGPEMKEFVVVSYFSWPWMDPI